MAFKPLTEKDHQDLTGVRNNTETATSLPQPEQKNIPEKKAEKETSLVAPKETADSAATATQKPFLLYKKNVNVPQVRDAITVEIEKIMEYGLNDAFNRLSPVAKQEFKLKGEQTALKIRDLLSAAHVKVKKIFRLILEWLKMLPGINKFFLEQEAKIKVDKILALKSQRP